MKKFLLIILAMTLQSPSFASIARVAGQAAGNNTAGAGGTLTKAFTGNVTAGNIVLVGAMGYCDGGGGGATMGISKSAGTATLGAFQLDKASTYIGGDGKLDIWRSTVTVTGSATIQITATGAGSCFINMGINEYTGFATAPIDGTPDSTSGTGATETTNAITTSLTGGLIFMISAEEATTNFTYTLSDTNVFNNSNGATTISGEIQDKLTTGTGPFLMTAITGNIWPWAAIAVAYKTTAGGAITPVNPRMVIISQ